MCSSPMQAEVAVELRRHQGAVPRFGALAACSRDEPVRDRLPGAMPVDVDHEAAAVRRRLSRLGSSGCRDGTFRRWRLCPRWGRERPLCPLHAVSGAGSGAIRDRADWIAPGVIATGRIMATVIPGSIQSNRDRAELVALRRSGTVEVLRQGGRVPGDRSIRLCDRGGDPDRRRLGARIGKVRGTAIQSRLDGSRDVGVSDTCTRTSIPVSDIGARNRVPNWCLGPIASSCAARHLPRGRQVGGPPESSYSRSSALVLQYGKTIVDVGHVHQPVRRHVDIV